MWNKCRINSRKKELRLIYVQKRKIFDRNAQKAKRQYWHTMQEELVNSQGNPKEFWRKIGKIGVGNERQNNIPMEITLSDGSICDDKNIVMDKWKNDFADILNQNSDDSYCVENLYNNIISDEFLDSEITIDEVYHVLKLSKSGKSPGVDNIPVELYKNHTALNALTRIFNVCYKIGKVPAMWSKGIITPIPKSSTSDPRDPMSYRGLTLAPVACI